MPVYIANYRSLDSDAEHVTGMFEFESESRLGTKANAHDARVCMLEMFGKQALSWTIFKVERKSGKSKVADGQLELDFRAPKVKKRKKNREYW